MADQLDGNHAKLFLNEPSAGCGDEERVGGLFERNAKRNDENQEQALLAFQFQPVVSNQFRMELGQ